MHGRRLHKELQVYREEAKKTEAEIKKLEEGEADEYEVRQQVRATPAQTLCLRSSAQTFASLGSDASSPRASA